MKTLTVALPGRSYDILIERGLLAQAGAHCRKVLPRAERLFVVTDSNVAPLYLERVRAGLEEAGFRVTAHTVPAGEGAKCAGRLSELWEAMMAAGLTRTDAVVALGGGVVGDLAGFAAATVLRGVDFVQMPTTLLAQVDSSVGGKVAIDLHHGKNLAGAFWQPRLVLMDPDALDTLDDQTFADGMAEVVKYGFIGDRELLELLEGCAGRRELSACIEEILRRSCDQKRRVVEADEQDTGGRMVLNFGHTLGHAYEKLGNYSRYMHGEAVSCGMVSILKMGEAHGLTAPGTAKRVEALLSRFGLPTRAEAVSPAALKETLAYDKKGSGGSLTAVFCR